MSEQTVTDISELLNQEKWTRATLNNYTVQNFKELDDTLQAVFESEKEDDVLAEAEEHLRHTKNSIIALYLSGVISVRRQTVDDANLIALTEIFGDNHKWNIVEYLCERILEHGENRDALRKLAMCYSNENQPEKMYEVWERLIRVDFEEADIVRQLAEKKEADGDTTEAVEYYKKALHRYISKKLFNNIREVWHRLIQYAPEQTEFFYHAENKIAKVISPERASQLLEELYPHFRKEAEWDIAIEILKRILHHDPRSPMARKEIIECYREKYADHSHLEEYIKLSNLTQSWRNIHDAIADFEKHISFDAGNFVFHRAWGVGIIRGIESAGLLIDFARKRQHRMTLKMAVSSLEILDRDHLWVLRSIWKKEKLHKKVKTDIEWALKTVIKSCGNAADIKRIKAELVPAVLSQNEWSSWSAKARQVLKTNKDFGTLTDKLDHYVVRDQPISFEEKVYNRFKAERDFFDRVKTISEFLAYIDNEELSGNDSDFFRDMFDYFVSYLKGSSGVNEYVICSNLLVRRIVARYPFMNPGIDLDFLNLYEEIADLEELFKNINSADLKREFINNVKRTVKDWPEIYVRLFPYFLSRDLINDLERTEHFDKLEYLFHRLYDNYRDLREAYVWLVRNCYEDTWFENLSMPFEKVLISMVHLLDITARDIDNKKETTQNRKIHRQIHSFLFKDEILRRHISTADESSLTRLFTLVSDVKNLDPTLVLNLKQIVLDRFPDFRFYGEEAKPRTAVARGLITTQASYERKQKQLHHIHSVEVPENSKEISRAASLGDLKENAEYKAAKERQDFLNSTAARLQEELQTAQIMRPDEIDSGSIGFGTTVTLENKGSGETEVFTILGPWESDPDNGVISYLSPLGSALVSHIKGEELSFVINDREYSYKVTDIDRATFS
ncbi:MAG: transcription elongation factor GreA [Spirochaetaceae bacterium]|nr:MAG: transcription elongation factor GreA [Spirochaetaceae bacterium]